MTHRLMCLLALLGGCGGTEHRQSSADSVENPETPVLNVVPPPSQHEAESSASSSAIEAPAGESGSALLPLNWAPRGEHDWLTQVAPIAAALPSLRRRYNAIDRAIGPTSAADTVSTGVASLRRQIDAASEELRALVNDVSLLSAHDPCWTSTLLGDAFGALAMRLEAMSLPLPLDVAAQLQGADPETVREVRTRIAASITEIGHAQAQPVWCAAITHYQRASSAEACPAATARLDGFGSVFVQSCVSRP